MSFHEQRRGRPERPRKRDQPVTPGRVAALGSLVAVAAVVVVIVLELAGGPGSHSAVSSLTATSARSQARHGSTSRTATPTARASVPILVYHVINTQPAGSSANPALYVPPDVFSSQMNALKAAGWHAVTLNQVEAYWTRGTSLGAGKPIVITFDDGYSSQYVNALPILKGLGWVGVENLPLTGVPPSEGGLTETEIRGLLAAGWELGTQGLTQTDLVTLDPTQLSNQVTAARQTMQSQFGVPVNWFSYPSGDYDATVIAAVRSAGYLGATTVNPGWASPQQDRFRLPRLVVVAGTTPSQLVAQIASAQTSTSIPSSYTRTGLA
ncbi:MAG TPA: polysaccharide deacetylase family protein [Solirubrobacteraceae bacterium]|nr:polysaccharide deacetylase family protein [Solirubrobacteraceae bacterium]